jgi:hypothetical protein
MRFLGAAGIPKGLTIGGPAGTNPNFTVRTTANWVGLAQQVSACETAQPGQAYVRIHVEVSTANLTGPQVIDTVVVPEASQTVDGTGSATVAVVDQMGAPVSDVAVRALDPVQPTNAFTLTTGSDGCLFLPSLKPSASLAVSVSRAGFVPSTPTGAAQTLQITAGSVARSTFELAAQATITFTAGDPEHPLPLALPMSWQVNTTGAAVTTSTADAIVTGLWPNTNGFSAWAGACTDANPSFYGATRQGFAFIAGKTTNAAVSAVPMKVRGLPADTVVTAKYAGADAACTNLEINLGRTNEVGVLLTALPYGDWTFDAAGETQPLIEPLVPTVDGTAHVVVWVNFTLADLDAPSSTATPTGSATVTATPTATPTVTTTPTPTATP